MNKRHKLIIVLACVIVLLVGIITGLLLSYYQKKSQKEQLVSKIKAEVVNQRELANEKEKNNEENRELTEEYKEYEKLPEEQKQKLEVVPRKYSVDYEELDKIIKKQKEELAKNTNDENVNNNQNVEQDESKSEEQIENKNEEQNENQNEKLDENQDKEQNNNQDKEQNNNQDKEQDNNQDKEQDNEQNEIVFESLPSKFNLNDKLTIEVEDQEAFGLCWSFAGLKSVETNIGLRTGKYYNFSEIHIDYLTSNLMTSTYRNVHEGGNFQTDFIDYIKNYKGFVNQEQLEYRDYTEEEYSNFYNMDKVGINVCETVEFPNYNREYSDWSEEQFQNYQDAIKRHIMNFGSIYASMNSPLITEENLYYADLDDAQNTSKRKDGNVSYHAMSIVGWDDNYSKDNFESLSGKKPEKDGAYIVLNSWGEDAGDKGYLYISYESYDVHSNLCGVISTDSKDLLNLSSLNNEILSNYLEREYKDYIIEIESTKYLNKIVLEDVSSLDLSGLGLTSLDGIEMFEFIWNIDLSNNNLTNVQNLNNLTELSVINLSNNNIKDVSCLKNNLNITDLDLSNNKDISGYEQISNVMSLNLKNCNIKGEDIDKIVNMENLNAIDLSKNDIAAYLSKLEGKYWYELTLNDCGLTNIPKIKVDYLDISNNKNIDLKTINNIVGLYALIARDCNITDISIIKDKISNIQILDLSDNKGIKNLSCLENVGYLILKNTDFTDVTELNDIEYIGMLDLSGNKNLKGVLKNHNDLELILDDCELTDSFDFFELDKVFSISLLGNNNCSIDHIVNEINANSIAISEIYVTDIDKIPEETMLVNCLIIENVEVPQNNVRINLSKKIKSLDKDTQYFNYDYKILNNSTIEFDNYKQGTIKNLTETVIVDGIHIDRFIQCKYQLNINVSENAKPISIEVCKLPNKIVFCEEELDYTGIEVKANYSDVYEKKINDYVIENPIELHEGKNNIKVYRENLECYFEISYYINKELKFNNANLFNKILELIDINGIEGVINIDKENMTIKMTKIGMDSLKDSYFCISSSMLDDIESLSILELSEIFIEYDGHKITNEDIQRLQKLQDLTNINIINNSLEKNEDIIVSQNIFTVNFINNNSSNDDEQDKVQDDEQDKVQDDVNNVEESVYINPKYSDPIIEDNTDAIEFTFKTEELFNKITSMTEESEIIRINYNKKTIKITILGMYYLRDSYFCIPSSMLNDIDALSELPLYEMFIQYDGDKITEEDIQKLERIKTLTDLHIINNSSEEDVDIIVNQDKFKVDFSKE